MSKERSYRIVAISHDDGIVFDKSVYHGRPIQAATKAFNWYCRKSGLKNCTRRFTIEEITKDSKRKHYHYVGRRKKLSTPKPVERNGVIYPLLYEIKVKKAA